MPLARFERDFTDEDGNLLTGNLNVEVRRESGGLVAVYSDREGASALGNPFVNSGGAVAFHCVGGAYKITITQGAFSRQLRYVPIGTKQEQDQGQEFAGISMQWETGTSTPPTAGCIRANNADLSAATEVYISETNIGGSSIAARLAELSAGDTITVSIASGAQVSWNITSRTDSGAYQTFGVNGHAGETALSATSVGLQLRRKGANGTDGTGMFSRVRVVATTNVAIATALENGDSIDGVTLATNDLVLLTGQTAPAENGIYVVPASGAASRDSSFDTYDEHPGVYVSVMEGTAKADTLWRCTSNKGGTLGTTALTFAEFTAGLSGLGANDNRLVRTDGTAGTTAQGSAVSVDDSGNMSGVGTLGVGAITTTGLLTTNGQVKFPSTANPSADANTLDEYEEGTWTPGMDFGTSASGVAYSAQVGLYTKIGRFVKITGNLTLTNNGSGAGNARLTGLPFTAAAGTDPGTVNFGFWGGTSGVAGNLFGYVQQSGTAVGIRYGGATGSVDATDTTITNSANLYFSGFYQANG